MQDRYVFRQINKEEIPTMFNIIIERMKWMDKVGIKQWNVTHYDQRYPISYYEQKREEGEVYVLVDKKKDKIVAVGVLKQEDDRWSDEQNKDSALYLHNFATVIGEKGIGKVYIKFAEQLAYKQGREYFRLDSADDNIPLEKYYTEQGYVPAGYCRDGLYTGILREKKLR